MNNDIKKILGKIKSVSDFDDYVDFVGTEFKPLLDYITNLQKSQETLIKNDNEIITNLQEEKTRTRYANDVERFTAYDFALKKLQELKGDGSNEN